MNYMGHNSEMSYNNGGYQPATKQLSPDQRMYIKNHPEMTVEWDNNYQHQNGCIKNNNTMNSNLIPRNDMLATAPNGNTVSLRPETMTNTDFLPAYLKQFVGRWVRCEFFIGDTVEQRVGVLHDVGASYIIIDVIEPQTLVVCDIFSLRFVTIVLDEEYGRLLRV